MGDARGQRTTLRLAGVEADVVLVKASAKPREAEYEVRRDGDEGSANGEQAEEPRADPLGGIDVSAGDAGVESNVIVAPRVRHGATAPNGEFVDLTEQLAAIDEATLLEGLEVVATVPLTAVPRERGRDALYVAAGRGSSTGAPAQRVLALVWSALREHRAGAVVRWTKRKNQAMGVLIARDEGGRHLALVELEWAQNLREVPERALIGSALDETSEAERQAAAKLVAALRDPEALIALRDERLARRADLLEATRAGHAWEAPADVEAPDEGAALVKALATA